MENLQTGNLVKVVKNETAHQFFIGEVVSFVQYEGSEIPVKKFETLDRKEEWYMTEEEFEVL